jgi:hypothetical protein
MMLLMFALYFMQTFTEWYWDEQNQLTKLDSLLHEFRVEQATEFFCYPLLWWFAVYLFLSLG